MHYHLNQIKNLICKQLVKAIFADETMIKFQSFNLSSGFFDELAGFKIFY